MNAANSMAAAKPAETRTTQTTTAKGTRIYFIGHRCIPIVYDALKKQEFKTRLRSKNVFLNPENKPIEIETLRKNAWTKGLKNAGLEYRPVIQTRHTFSAMMIAAGENYDWVQRMMGHAFQIQTFPLKIGDAPYIIPMGAGLFLND